MEKTMKKMKNKEIVIIAMIAAVLGVLFMFLDTMYSTISMLLGPVLTNLTFGIYALTALLPMVIVKKPGAALLGGFIGAIANILAGSPYGINIVVAGLLQGLGCEIGFYLGKYKVNLVTLILSGIFITICVTTRDYFIFGLNALPPTVLIFVIIVRLLSATFIGGYISKAIEKGLQKTGVLQNM
ncbi:hypothetical protein E9840_02975 [Tissierella creatinini]|nr:hypothetical protein E9840_02975 [Tissierella creatinini]TJX67255.1 hypothetical protein E8P77_05610 [Soehngenia saccharolytica]